MGWGALAGAVAGPLINKALGGGKARGGGSSSGSTAPWAPAQPHLKALLNRAAAIDNAGVNTGFYPGKPYAPENIYEQQFFNKALGSNNQAQNFLTGGHSISPRPGSPMIGTPTAVNMYQSGYNPTMAMEANTGGEVVPTENMPMIRERNPDFVAAPVATQDRVGTRQVRKLTHPWEKGADRYTMVNEQYNIPGVTPEDTRTDLQKQEFIERAAPEMIARSSRPAVPQGNMYQSQALSTQGVPANQGVQSQYLGGVIDQAEDRYNQAIDDINSRAGAAGRSGGFRHQLAVNDAAGGFGRRVADLLLQDEHRRADRGLQAAQVASGLQDDELRRSAMAGGAQRAFDNLETQEQMARYAHERDAPWQGLHRYLNVAGHIGGLGGTSTGTSSGYGKDYNPYINPIGDAVGLGVKNWFNNRSLWGTGIPGTGRVPGGHS